LNRQEENLLRKYTARIASNLTPFTNFIIYQTMYLDRLLGDKYRLSGKMYTQHGDDLLLPYSDDSGKRLTEWPTPTHLYLDGNNLAHLHDPTATLAKQNIEQATQKFKHFINQFAKQNGGGTKMIILIFDKFTGPDLQSENSYSTTDRTPNVAVCSAVPSFRNSDDMLQRCAKMLRHIRRARPEIHPLFVTDDNYLFNLIQSYGINTMDVQNFLKFAETSCQPGINIPNEEKPSWIKKTFGKLFKKTY